MGLVWPSLERCLVASGCCLWEQCSTYEKLIENSCFQLAAVPQRTCQPSNIWSRSREKPQFSCGMKVWGDYIFIIPIYDFNLLQRAEAARTNGVNLNFDQADGMSSDRVWKSDYCNFRAWWNNHLTIRTGNTGTFQAYLKQKGCQRWVISPQINRFSTRFSMKQVEKSNQKRKTEK